MRRAHEFHPWLLGIWTTAVMMFIIVPLIFVFLVSLTPLNHISLPVNDISVKWYLKLMDHPAFLHAAWNSLWLSISASALSCVMGVMAAVASVRGQFPLLQPLRLFATSPLFIPMVMSGLAILVFSANTGFQNQGLRTFVAHTCLTLPYVFRTVSASLSGFDMNQELAARNLGASEVRAFVLVTLPQLGPGLLAGGLFAFIVSFDNVGMSIFLTGSKFQTLPVELFVYASYNSDPMIAAASVTMIFVSILTIALVEKYFGIQKLMRH